MTSTVLPGVPPDIDLINGPMLLGNLFGYMFYGILIVQVFIYSSRFQRDPKWMKGLVWFVLGVDTLMSILFTITAWDGLAKGWGDLNTLSQLDWPFNALPCLSGLVSSTVHVFFCWRIWKLAKIVSVPILIMAISVTSWAMASYCGITSVAIGVARIGELRPFVIVWLGGVAIADALVTATMVYILFRAGAKSAFSQTNSVVGKLITLTVETGMTTTAGALIELIFFFAFPHNNMHFLPFLFLAKLYSNTLLATLNARAAFNGERRGTHPAALWDDDVSSTQLSSRGKVPYNGVQITTATTRHADHELVVIEGRSAGLAGQPYPPSAFNPYSPDYQGKKSDFIDFESTEHQNDGRV
ncbi:hypothetical protein BDZ89DRAFT_1156934 [Hymenopellis radicata]|nr:hypothetical protein BDZ89DRAFT_1156934 [Hymenopellis radicata]